MVTHSVKSSPDRPIIRSETSKHVILNRLNISCHPGIEDWACDIWNAPALDENNINLPLWFISLKVLQIDLYFDLKQASMSFRIVLTCPIIMATKIGRATVGTRPCLSQTNKVRRGMIPVKKKAIQIRVVHLFLVVNVDTAQDMACKWLVCFYRTPSGSPDALICKRRKKLWKIGSAMWVCPHEILSHTGWDYCPATQS